MHPSPSLIIGNKDSNVAVCTLWSETKIIARKLNKKYFAVMGNLYSPGGINNIIRSLLASSNLRYFVLMGADLRKTGDTVVAFFKDGVKDGKIIGTQIAIEKEIPTSAIELLRNNVSLVDMRKHKFSEINAKMKELNKKQTKPYSKPLTFPEAISAVPSIPSEHTGFVFRGKTIASVWLRLLDATMKFGEVKNSEYNVEQKELLNVVSVIYEKDETLPSWIGISDEQLKQYFKSVTKAKKHKGVSYTYGERLFGKNGLSQSQVNVVIAKLKKKPFTRRAVVVCYQDKDLSSEHPPCLTQVAWNIKENKLYQTSIFRSHDIYGSFAMNMLAMKELQQIVATKLGLDAGPLTCISNSAHIYATDYRDAAEILKKHYSVDYSKFEIDPRGVFKIDLHGEDILVQHLTSDGQKTGHYFWGKNPERILAEIIHSNLVSRMDHAAYLGKELQKAYYALVNRKKYVQDRIK